VFKKKIKRNGYWM